MKQFPLTSKSTHPDVVAAAAARREAEKTFRDQGCAFAVAHGSPDGAFTYRSSWGGELSITGIVCGTKPTTGRWKKSPCGTTNAWVPWENNPVSGVMADIKVPSATIPGMPAMVWDTNRSRIGNSAVFTHDGVVYAKVPFRGDETDTGKAMSELDTFGWEETLESEWHTARQKAYPPAADAA